MQELLDLAKAIHFKRQTLQTLLKHIKLRSSSTAWQLLLLHIFAGHLLLHAALQSDPAAVQRTFQNAGASCRSVNGTSHQLLPENDDYLHAKRKSRKRKHSKSHKQKHSRKHKKRHDTSSASSTPDEDEFHDPWIGLLSADEDTGHIWANMEWEVVHDGNQYTVPSGLIYDLYTTIVLSDCYALLT